MKRSNIGWTDYSGGDLNFVIRGRKAGDCEASSGCANCYAKAVLDRFEHGSEETTYSATKLERLRRWNVAKDIEAVLKGEAKPFRRNYQAPLAFVADMGDLFHPNVPDQFIIDFLVMVIDKPEVTWQVLTKRADRMQRIVSGFYGEYNKEPPIIPNLWLGVTAENQAMADQRMPYLLDTPAAVRFVSIEPMLEPINLKPWLDPDWAESLSDATYKLGCIVKPNWVIVGAESGPNRRPFNVAWAEDIYHQCQAAGIACFLKQDSGLKPGAPLLIGGREIKEFPCTGNTAATKQAVSPEPS